MRAGATISKVFFIHWTLPWHPPQVNIHWTTLYPLPQVNTLDSLLADKDLQFKITKSCCEAKLRICSADSKDLKAGSFSTIPSREVLNFGHTVGHAVEAETWLPHGLCVSIGMVQEMGCARSELGEKVRLEVTNTFAQYDMPISLPSGMDVGQLMRYVRNDKKVRV